MIGAALLLLAQATHRAAPAFARDGSSASYGGAAPAFARDGSRASSGAASPVAAAQDFATFLEGVRKDALARGIRAETVNAALADLEPSPTVIERDQSQAETVLTVDQYLARRLTRSFVRTGQQKARAHRSLLRRVEERYDVQRRFLVSIWGMESNYGRFSGVRPTVQALATLAWEGRRGAFFRGELLDALQIVDRGYIPLERLRGSWAGAMGQPQFMPSSYLKWAQDFDADGDRDIWASEGDIFASIANYLKEHGWKGDETWGREVKLPRSIDAMHAQVPLRTEGCRAEREMTERRPLSEWQKLGVRTTAGRALPRAALDASLVHTGRRAYLVYGNYEALLEYNCAHSYALAVALLADRVGG